MKKGRSGWIFEVICLPAEADKLSKLILRETTAFGIRMHRMERIILERHHITVATPFGDVEVKVGSLEGKTLQQSPEFSSCSAAAERHGVPVRLVYQAALAAVKPT